MSRSGEMFSTCCLLGYKPLLPPKHCLHPQSFVLTSNIIVLPVFLIITAVLITTHDYSKDDDNNNDDDDADIDGDDEQPFKT